jgi:DNA-binding NarL/FixJ family response regulator
MSVEATPTWNPSVTEWPLTGREVLVVSADTEFPERIEDALDPAADVEVTAWDHTTDPDELVDVVGRSTVMVVIGPDVNGEIVSDFAKELHEEHPHVSVVIVHKASKRLLRAALRARAHDVIEPDTSLDELRAILLGVLASADQHPSNVPTTEGPAAVTPAGAATQKPNQFARSRSGEAAWWSSIEGNQAFTTLRQSRDNPPGSAEPSEPPALAWSPTMPDHDDLDDDLDDQDDLDDADDLVDVTTIETLITRAQASLDHLARVTDLHTAARDQIDQTNAIILNVVAELAGALEQIRTELGD